LFWVFGDEGMAIMNRMRRAVYLRVEAARDLTGRTVGNTGKSLEL
jgi:hypothetical protein